MYPACPTNGLRLGFCQVILVSYLSCGISYSLSEFHVSERFMMYIEEIFYCKRFCGLPPMYMLQCRVEWKGSRVGILACLRNRVIGTISQGAFISRCTTYFKGVDVLY